jgi:exodeoxyribonuclease VII large subunit
MSNANDDRIRTIRQINAQVRSVLEHETVGYPIWVGGIVTRCFVSDRGHTYFDLYDDEYSINCFLRENLRGTLDFTISNGMEIEVFGQVRVFEPQVKVQIDVEQAQLIKRPLFVIDRSIEEQLEKRGLWPKEKKPLPEIIKSIGLITSKNSRALQDFEDTFRQEGGTAQVKLFDVRLQGQQAPREIADTITRLNRDNLVDVIVLVRGGGRVVELAVFNDYLIGEAICRSTIPVITGIGHQRDETFADQVADASVITPTAAATLLAKRKPVIESAAPALQPQAPFNSTQVTIALIAAVSVIVIVLLLVSNRP